VNSPEVLIAAATLALTIAGAVAFWANRINKGENALEIAKSALAKADECRKELADFKVHVAANYASNSTIEAMEARLIEAINRLGDRLDRVLERSSGHA
jgi:propanediol dehydratase large subunit